MNWRQLLALFLCQLVPWTIGYGISPLLPAQTSGLGASQAVAGACLALSQLAMAVGTLTAGWLSGRLRRLKKLTTVAGLVSIPALYLMGRATTIWSLAAALSVWFFCAGMTLALNSIVAGVSAEPGRRGKVFGLLSLAAGLGALLGGPLGGPIVDRHGYASMYAFLALLSVITPLLALLRAECSAAPAKAPNSAPAASSAALGRGFRLLFVASLVAAVSSFVFFVGRSFAMADLGFSCTAVSSAASVGEAIAFPFPLLAAWLSDRLGRKRFLALSFAATALGLLLLCLSTEPWHFWLASALFTLSFVGGPVGSALAADLLPSHSLGRGLGLYGATTWLGGIGGCLLTGYAVQGLGITPTLIAGAVLPLLAIGLLAPVASCRRPAVETPARQGSLAPADLLPARLDSFCLPSEQHAWAPGPISG